MGWGGFAKYVVIFLSGISCCGWILALNPVWVPTGPDWLLCQPVPPLRTMR